MTGEGGGVNPRDGAPGSAAGISEVEEGLRLHMPGEKERTPRAGVAAATLPSIAEAVMGLIARSMEGASRRSRRAAARRTLHRPRDFVAGILGRSGFNPLIFPLVAREQLRPGTMYGMGVYKSWGRPSLPGGLGSRISPRRLGAGLACCSHR